ncbi:MAG: hypothetical protein ABI995_12560 [Acidobacteriota bacterium]
MSQFANVILLFGGLLSASTGFAQERTVKLNGGLEAELITLGRDATGYNLSASLRIANKGKSIAYLLLVADTVATDNAGGTYNRLVTIGGLASCPFTFSPCNGINPSISGTPPLQSFTQIDPGVEITVNLRLSGDRGKGPLVSLSANVAYRLVIDQLKDETLSEAEQRKQVRLMTISFPPMAVIEGK